MLTMKNILARIDSALKKDAFGAIEDLPQLSRDIAEQIQLDEPHKSDVSTSNPRLHVLYVNWAMEHLEVINRFMEELDGFSNLNLLDLQSALHQKRADLLLHNTAYRDAMIRILAGLGPIEKEAADEGNVNVGTVEDDGDLDDGAPANNIHIFIIEDDGIDGAL